MFRLGIEVSTVEFLGRESDLTRSCVGVLISSTYLGTLKTPDIGKISAILGQGKTTHIVTFYYVPRKRWWEMSRR